MVCKQCGKEINKEQERKDWNSQHPNGPSYDEMGYSISEICLTCKEKNQIELIKETKSHIL